MDTLTHSRAASSRMTFERFVVLLGSFIALVLFLLPALIAFCGWARYTFVLPP